MSALRLGRLPDGTRHVQVIDEGAVGRVTHARYGVKGTYIGGAIVTERPKAPAILPATTPARQEQMRVYRSRIKDQCGREFTGNYVGRCARASGHGGECASAKSLESKARRQRATVPGRGRAFSIHPENRR